VNTERLAAVAEKHAQAEGDVQAGLSPDLDPDYPLHTAGRFVAAFPLTGEENALALSRANRVDAVMAAAQAVREAAREEPAGGDYVDELANEAFMAAAEAAAARKAGSDSAAYAALERAFERVKEAERNAERVRGVMVGLDSESFTRCEHCLELEQKIVTLRRTAESLSKQLAASSSKLVSEVARARAEGREEGRAAANDDTEAAREREGAGW
jgi:hypothetical protein